VAVRVSGEAVGWRAGGQRAVSCTASASLAASRLATWRSARSRSASSSRVCCAPAVWRRRGASQKGFAKAKTPSKGLDALLDAQRPREGRTRQAAQQRGVQQQPQRAAVADDVAALAGRARETGRQRPNCLRHATLLWQRQAAASGAARATATTASPPGCGRAGEGSRRCGASQQRPRPQCRPALALSCLAAVAGGRDAPHPRTARPPACPAAPPRPPRHRRRGPRGALLRAKEALR
jgi:hypothetical protein